MRGLALVVSALLLMLAGCGGDDGSGDGGTGGTTPTETDGGYDY